MLSKEERLRKNSEFRSTYRISKSVANSLFVLYTGRFDSNNQLPRVGFVVTKKIHKSSVKRNRIKRIAREAYKKFKTNNPEKVTKWRNLIFIARDGALNMDFQACYDNIENCINKANCKFIKTP